MWPAAGEAPGRTMPASGVSREAGGASLMVLACAGVLMVLATALAVAGAMVVAHRRAQAAADLTALAAATHGCARAAAVAADNGASLVECRGGPRRAAVRVQVPGPRWFGLRDDFVGRARAGPSG